jgi:hypothetical protein
MNTRERRNFTLQLQENEKLFIFGEELQVQGTETFSEKSGNWQSDSVTSEGLVDS